MPLGRSWQSWLASPSHGYPREGGGVAGRPTGSLHSPRGSPAHSVLPASHQPPGSLLCTPGMLMAAGGPPDYIQTPPTCSGQCGIHQVNSLFNSWRCPQQKLGAPKAAGSLGPSHPCCLPFGFQNQWPGFERFFFHLGRKHNGQCRHSAKSSRMWKGGLQRVPRSHLCTQVHVRGHIPDPTSLPLCLVTGSNC